MLTQTSDTWWHFLYHSTRRALCHTARTATSNGVVLQRLLRTLEAGEVLPWGDGDGTVFSNSKIGIAVLIFKFIKLVYLCLMFISTWTPLDMRFFSPPWQRKCLISEALQHKDPATAHVPWAAGEVFSWDGETKTSTSFQKSPKILKLEPFKNWKHRRMWACVTCDSVWLQCFPSITNDCSRTQRSFEDTLEGSRALSSWITLLTNLVVAPGSSQENFRKICNIFCNTAFFEKSNIFPKKTKL